ncbi:hypothetical protein PG991_006267 [Apiospora marii]|uniref:Uncharacterized protein n=1 Tax=Apiospora marii TaxID=335849 RepID=A0ABR1SBI5_9PEZI
MASSRPVSRTGIAAVHKVTNKIYRRTKYLERNVKGADQMTKLADKMLRCGTLQVGLHFELDLRNDTISTREDVTPAAFMQAMGCMPVAEKPEAKEYMAAALSHLHIMSDPLPFEFVQTAIVNLDAGNAPTSVYRDTLTRLMSDISTFHACTTAATSSGYSYLESPIVDPELSSKGLFDDLLELIIGSFGLFVMHDHILKSLHVYLRGATLTHYPKTQNEALQLFLAGSFENLQAGVKTSPRLITVEVMLRIARDMARINFFTRVVGHSLMIAFGRFDPENPDGAVQWQGTDIASIARSYKNFELLEHRMIGVLTAQVDSPINYKIDAQSLEDPVLQKLLEPTVKALQQQPGLEQFKLEHVLDPANNHFHAQFNPSD